MTPPRSPPRPPTPPPKPPPPPPPAPPKAALEAARSPAAGAPAGPAAEQPLEEVAEVVAGEVAPAEVHAHVVEAFEAIEARRPRDILPRLPVGSEPVVALALLGVAKHLVGLGDLLEAVLGALILVDVGVVLAGGAAVRARGVLALPAPR